MNGRIVYSTDPARQPCPRCRQHPCECPPEGPTPPPERQALTVRIDRKARRGKTVTLIEGFVGSKLEREELAARLKRRCGAGGSVEGEAILLQGDKKGEVLRLLEELGYSVRSPR